MNKQKLKQIIYEELNDKVYEQFNITISYLRKQVFPKLDDDQLVEYLKELKNWIDKNYIA